MSINTQSEPARPLSAIFGESPKTQVLDVLADADWVDDVEIVNGTDFDDRVIKAALDDLEETGIITSERTRSGSRWRFRIEAELGERMCRIAQEVFR